MKILKKKITSASEVSATAVPSSPKVSVKKFSEWKEKMEIGGNFRQRAERAGVPLVECTPLQVKLASTGYGKADKRQVQQMITRVLKLKEIPRPDDTADALAIALCASSMPITH